MSTKCRKIKCNSKHKKLIFVFSVHRVSLSLQCRNGTGACPDTDDSRGSCTNDVALVQGWKENGQQCVIFSRNFTSSQSPSLSLTLSCPSTLSHFSSLEM